MSELLPRDTNGRAIPVPVSAKGGGARPPARRQAEDDERQLAREDAEDRDDDGESDEGAKGHEHRPGPQLPSMLLAGYHERLAREKRTRRRRLAVSLSIFVILPTLLSAVLFGWFITPRYVSEAQMTVQSDDTQALGLLSGILGSVGSAGNLNVAPVLIEYIHSQAMLDTLQEWLDLKSHYSQDGIDVFSRLEDSPTKEEFLDYYRSRVEAVLDTETHIIRLNVQAYDPDYAKAVAEAAITLTEDLANSLSDRRREDSVNFARREVQRAEERLRGVRMMLVEFRNEHKDLDPAGSAAAIAGIVGGIEQDLSTARTEMAGMRAFMRDDSPQMIAIKARINALNEQLKQEKARLVGKGTSDAPETYNQVLAAYEQILIEEEFAREAFSSATTALEAARVTAARQTSYIVDFVPPLLPDEAGEPEVGMAVLTTFLVSLLAFALGGLLVTAIREQAGL